MSRMDGPKASFNSVLTILAVGWWALCPGQAWAQAHLALNPPSGVDFGDQRVGVESDAESLSVHNIGDDTATDVLCSVVIRPGGNDPEAFSISGCPTTLAAGASFETDISFLPTSAGAKGAQLLVFYDSGTGSTDVSVDLDGVGIDGPDLSVNGDWSDIEIGQQHVSAGATDPAIQVTMENQPTADDLTISAFNLIGASCSEFALGFSTTPLTIPAGTTDYFSVTFDPSEHGVKACEVRFVSDDPDPPDTVMVTGTGTNQTVEVTPSGYDFGAIDVSGGAVAKDFFIVNDGDLGDLIVSSVSLNGATCGAFSLIGVPTIPFNISPGDIETVTVAFDPPVADGYDCDIEILSNDAGTPALNIPLVGTGIELEPIFADGFESGTTDSWSVVAP